MCLHVSFDGSLDVFSAASAGVHHDLCDDGLRGRSSESGAMRWMIKLWMYKEIIKQVLNRFSGCSGVDRSKKLDLCENRFISRDLLWIGMELHWTHSFAQQFFT